MLWFFGAIGGLLISALSFLMGRMFAQSEAILDEKRRIYEEFLRACPKPNDAYAAAAEGNSDARFERMGEVQSVLALYAAPNVALAVKHYFEAFGEADGLLTETSPPRHPAFLKAAKAHNDLILEMRRDALSWSAFSYHGKSRLPADALEQARKSTT